MEFEQDTPVSDDERRLAEARKLILSPLHSDIQPESTPELDEAYSERATQTQANVSNDIEDTSNNVTLVTPSKSALQRLSQKTDPASTRKMVIPVVIVVGIFVLVIATLLFTSR